MVTEMVNELSAKETGDNEEKKRKRENESKGEKFEKRAKNAKDKNLHFRLQK